MFCRLAVLALGTAMVVLGCAPIGGGDDPNVEIDPVALTNSVRFQLVFAPPLKWTTATVSLKPEQSPTVEEAKETTVAAIEVALNAVFKEVNAAVPENVNYDFGGIVPKVLTLAGAPPNTDEGIVEMDVVAYICRPPAAATTCADHVGYQPLKLNQTVGIRNGPYLTGSSWGVVASRLFSQLSADAGVHFYQEIKVVKY